LDELFEHCKRPDFQYRHVWNEGDLVMWDNWATQHRGTGGYSSEHRRMMHRTTLTPTEAF
ncbi:MAG: TauD/TfdA family dioxygenase, partial [Hoeflea sp. D1-CHI-28]